MPKNITKKEIKRKPLKKGVDLVALKNRIAKKKGKVGRPRKNKSGQVLDKTTGKFRTGRPKSITEMVLHKLIEAFSIGCSDEEACAFAEISPSTLYDYQKNNPDFSERKECFKNLPTFKARKKLVESLEKDVEMAKWWMQKKRKKEFGEDAVPGTAVQVNNNNFKPDNYFEETNAKNKLQSSH